MDDKKIMDLIQESAEDVKIPESLEPENILKQIKETTETTEKKDEIAERRERKRIPFHKYGSWAAVAAIALIGVSTAGPAFQKTRDKNTEVQAVSELETEAAVSVETDVLEETNSKEAVITEEILAEDAAEEAVKEMMEEAEEDAMALEASEEEETSNDIKPSADIEENIEDKSVKTAILQAESYEEVYRILQEYRERYSICYDYEDDVVYEMAEDMDMGAADRVYSSAAAPFAKSVTSSEDIMMEEEKAVADDYSSTNVREEGIEEADCVKTDGNYIYAMDSSGNIRILDVKQQKLISELPFEEDGRRAEMYIDGDLLQIVKTAEIFETLRMKGVSGRTTFSQRKPQCWVYSYDISDRENPVLKNIYTQDGGYLTSRRKDGCLYLFTSFWPYYDEEQEAVDGYIPKAGEELLPCEKIYYLHDDRETLQYDGNSFLVAGSLKDENTSEAEDQICIVNGSGLFYVSQNNIYTAAPEWSGNQNATEILRFGYKDGKFEEGCSAKIPGRVEDSFCMDEYEGNLRLVTTVEGYWPDWVGLFRNGNTFYRSNRLYVLNEDLEILGKILGIARNEEIKSARFMGEIGYFVTYENTDPLFSVDLSDPQNPVILGELSITGFSEYLHPYGADQLLGIGWETDPESGMFNGLKCSMFDTSDPVNVKEKDRLIITDADYSVAMEEYKAIMINPQKNLFGFAYGGYGASYENSYFYGVFTYDEENGFTQLAYLPIPGQDSDSWFAWEGYHNARGIYIGENFYLVNDYGIFVYAMDQEFAKTNEIIW